MLGPFYTFSVLHLEIWLQKVTPLEVWFGDSGYVGGACSDFGNLADFSLGLPAGMGGGASAVQATLGRGEEARGLWGDSEGLTSQDRSLGATCAALAAAAPAAADLVQRGGLRRRESAGGLVLPEPAGLASHAAGGGTSLGTVALALCQDD